MILALAIYSLQTISDDDIFRMGRQKWFDYYTTKNGSSTASMADAEVRFGDALYRLNNVRLKAMPAGNVKTVNTVRIKLKSFCSDLVEVGYALTGGGTMWVNVSAGSHSDIEEAVGRVTGLIKNQVPLTVVSKTTKELAKLDVSVRSQMKDPYFKTYDGNGGVVLKRLNRAKATYKSIVAIAAKCPAPESNAYLNCCYQASVYLTKFGED